MTQIYFALATIAFSLSSYSMTYTCTHKGKSVDLNDPDVKVFIEGEVLCLRDWGKENQKERLILSKGKKQLEEIESPRRHEVKRFTLINGNEIEDGEQLEYHPGTGRIKTKVVKVKGRESGLKESFYPSGKIQERQFFEIENENRGPVQTASIGYHENGKIQFLRCGTSKKNTIDAELCGFEGARQVITFNEKGEQRSKVTYLNGKKTETEEAAKTQSRWASVLQAGTLREPKAAKRNSKINSDNSSVVTDSYENGKPKRIMNIGEDGSLNGADDEWFETGGKARHTVYGKSDDRQKRLIVLESQCWWENGKKRATVTRKGEQIEIQNFFDNGQPEFSGQYSYNPNKNYYWRDSDVEGLVSCEPYSYSLESEGLHKTWTREGVIQYEAEFVKGQRHGLEKLYDKTGELVSETFFEKDKMKRRKTFKDKKLQKDEEFFADGSVK